MRRIREPEDVAVEFVLLVGAMVAAFVLTGLTVSDLIDNGAVRPVMATSAVVAWVTFGVAFLRMP